MLWLHTYAERYVDAVKSRPASVPRRAEIDWREPVTEMPERPADVRYDAKTQCLTVGDGVLSGVSPEVWEYEVSGMPVVKKWTGYRTKRGAGRAASSTNELDKIRLEEWPQEWSDELRDLITVLTFTVETHAEQDALLDAICEGELIPESEVPKPTAEQRDEPKNTRNFAQGTLIQ